MKKIILFFLMITIFTTISFTEELSNENAELALYYGSISSDGKLLIDATGVGEMLPIVRAFQNMKNESLMIFQAAIILEDLYLDTTRVKKGEFWVVNHYVPELSGIIKKNDSWVNARYDEIDWEKQKRIFGFKSRAVWDDKSIDLEGKTEFFETIQKIGFGPYNNYNEKMTREEAFSHLYNIYQNEKYEMDNIKQGFVSDGKDFKNPENLKKAQILMANNYLFENEGDKLRPQDPITKRYLLSLIAKNRLKTKPSIEILDPENTTIEKLVDDGISVHQAYYYVKYPEFEKNHFEKTKYNFVIAWEYDSNTDYIMAMKYFLKKQGYDLTVNKLWDNKTDLAFKNYGKTALGVTDAKFTSLIFEHIDKNNKYIMSDYIIYDLPRIKKEQMLEETLDYSFYEDSFKYTDYELSLYSDVIHSFTSAFKDSRIALYRRYIRAKYLRNFQAFPILVDMDNHVKGIVRSGAYYGYFDEEPYFNMEIRGASAFLDDLNSIGFSTENMNEWMTKEVLISCLYTIYKSTLIIENDINNLPEIPDGHKFKNKDNLKKAQILMYNNLLLETAGDNYNPQERVMKVYLIATYMKRYALSQTDVNKIDMKKVHRNVSFEEYMKLNELGFIMNRTWFYDRNSNLKDGQIEKTKYNTIIMWGLGFEPEYVKIAQYTLSELGYYNGEIDGLWGSKSRAALKEYGRDYLNNPDIYLTSYTYDSFEEFAGFDSYILYKTKPWNNRK